jgi:hypothetical protein
MELEAREKCFSAQDLELAGQITILLYKKCNENTRRFWEELSSFKKLAANLSFGEFSLDSALYETTELLRKGKRIPDENFAKIGAEMIAWGIAKPKTND